VSKSIPATPDDRQSTNGRPEPGTVLDPGMIERLAKVGVECYADENGKQLGMILVRPPVTAAKLEMVDTFQADGWVCTPPGGATDESRRALLAELQALSAACERIEARLAEQGR
jgi:hypothetical protein